MPIKLDLSPFKGMFYYAQFNFVLSVSITLLQIFLRVILLSLDMFIPLSVMV